MTGGTRRLEAGTGPHPLSLRDEFEFRIRTAIAYGRARGKWGEAVSEEWVQAEIDQAVRSRAAARQTTTERSVRGETTEVQEVPQ